MKRDELYAKKRVVGTAMARVGPNRFSVAERMKSTRPHKLASSSPQRRKRISTETEEKVVKVRCQLARSDIGT